MGRCLGWPAGGPGEHFQRCCKLPGATVVSRCIDHNLCPVHIHNRRRADAHPVVVLALILLVVILLVVLLTGLLAVALLTLLVIALLCLVAVFLALLLLRSL